ncbi:MAG: hypothetical protein IKI95_09260 [Clostridia bacterium]|nr:hypothetical protein [Clostridia bacterium]
MAFNNINPFLGNNSLYPQYNSSVYPQYQNNLQQQHMIRQQQFQNQYETPVLDVKFVTSEEAKAHIVFPNTNALLIDKANKIAYLKSADGLGQSSTRNFKYEELDESKLSELKSNGSQPKIDLTGFIKEEQIKDFVTIDKMNEALKKFGDTINNQLFEIKKSINIKKAIEEGIASVDPSIKEN